MCIGVGRQQLIGGKQWFCIDPLSSTLPTVSLTSRHFDDKTSPGPVGHDTLHTSYGRQPENQINEKEECKSWRIWRYFYLLIFCSGWNGRLYWSPELWNNSIISRYKAGKVEVWTSSRDTDFSIICMKWRNTATNNSQFVQRSWGLWFYPTTNQV